MIIGDDETPSGNNGPLDNDTATGESDELAVFNNANDSSDSQKIANRSRGATKGADKNANRQKSNVSHKDDTRAVKRWLEYTVRLPQYYETFVGAGYESIEILIEIDDRNDLKEIGIKLPGHQTKIMAEIRRLKNRMLMDDKIIPHQGSIALEYGGDNDDEYESKLPPKGMSEIQLEGGDIVVKGNDERTNDGSDNENSDDKVLNDSFLNDDSILKEVETKGNFEQNLGDNIMGNELLMDDIIEDMDATPQ